MKTNVIAVVLFVIAAGVGAAITRPADVARLDPIVTSLGSQMPPVQLRPLEPRGALTTLLKVAATSPRHVFVASSSLCMGCQAELIRAEAAFADIDQVSVSGLILADDDAAADEAVRGVNVSFPLFRVDRKASRGLGSRIIPLTLIVDAEGNLLFSEVGPEGIDDAAKWLR